jgi:hypothetical protein
MMGSSSQKPLSMTIKMQFKKKMKVTIRNYKSTPVSSKRRMTKKMMTSLTLEGPRWISSKRELEKF